MRAQSRTPWSDTIKTGLLGGVVALLLSLVGLIEASAQRAVIVGILSMGHTILLLIYIWAAQQAVHRLAADPAHRPSRLELLAHGAVAGLLTSACLAALVFLSQWINLRAVFINASPVLFDLLTLKLGTWLGGGVLLIGGAFLGVLVASLLLLPDRLRKPLVLAMAAVPVVSILSSALFAIRGLSPLGALILFATVAGSTYLWQLKGGAVRERTNNLSPAGQRTIRWLRWLLPAIIILLLPLLGKYPSEVLDNVGLYVLMGLGLNIVVGFAGLLDLGYVAFFALGAYTMGILTSPEIQWTGITLTFWEALPFSVIVATIAGILLGIPVLGMRGDYLAIVTLGFGEIIRLVALSDWLKPYIGGSNGITRIPKAVVGPLELATPQTLYYLIVLGCLIVAFVTIRVKDSRLGRAWMAVREDEDVAQAMGIDLVRTKLLAFATGAAFSGLSGAIFASKLTSIYPHSFHLLVSINVLCLIIVGGMGSIPGVIVGSLALVGLPELLREFSEYRLLLYGAALVFMMLNRPEGLMPEARRKLELHEVEAGASE
ncbi:MAG: branched-chain amino acid ABC transporter permease [Anaerolineae bacterium]